MSKGRKTNAGTIPCIITQMRILMAQVICLMQTTVGQRIHRLGSSSESALASLGPTLHLIYSALLRHGWWQR